MTPIMTGRASRFRITFTLLVSTSNQLVKNRYEWTCARTPEWSSVEQSLRVRAVGCWGGECDVIGKKVTDGGALSINGRGAAQMGSAQRRWVWIVGRSGGMEGSGRWLLDSDTETNIRDRSCTQCQLPSRRGVPGQLRKAAIPTSTGPAGSTIAIKDVHSSKA